MEVLELLTLVNSELKKNRSLTSIAKDLEINESTIRKKLNKVGYKRVGNQFIINSDITSNITNTPKEIAQITSNITTDNNIITEKNIEFKTNLNIDKLSLLLDNLDNLLKLIPSNITSNITQNFRSGINDVKSFRIDTGLYSELKNRASKNNTNMAEILNRALEDYLNNYL